eukprot:UN31251
MVYHIKLYIQKCFSLCEVGEAGNRELLANTYECCTESMKNIGTNMCFEYGDFIIQRILNDVKKILQMEKVIS